MRLQDLTRKIAGIPIPKQYCRLLNNSSLLEATLARTQLFAPPDRISVIINQKHTGLAMKQLNTLPESNIFVQPQNRDTGPGMIFSLCTQNYRLRRALEFICNGFQASSDAGPISRSRSGRGLK